MARLPDQPFRVKNRVFGHFGVKYLIFSHFHGFPAGNDGIIAGNDGIIAGNDRIIAGNDGTIAGNGGTIAGNDGTIAGNDGTIAGNDGTIAGNGGTAAGNGGTAAGNGGTAAGNDGTIAGAPRQRAALIFPGNGGGLPTAATMALKFRPYSTNGASRLPDHVRDRLARRE